MQAVTISTLKEYLVIEADRSSLPTKENMIGLFYDRYHYTPSCFGQINRYCFGFFSNPELAQRAYNLILPRTKLLSELYIENKALTKEVIVINPFSNIHLGFRQADL